MFVYFTRMIATGLAIAFLVLGTACTQNFQPAQTSETETSESAPKSQPVQTTANAAGVSWTVPARWTVQPQSPMRIATYSVPVAAGDQEPGECAVYFFGTGQGGDIESNITRWHSQFEGLDGETPELNWKKSEINSLSVTTMSVVGTYLASMGPMFQQGTVKKPGYKMLGAIIEAPEGNVFVKFTGPEKTVIAAEKEFKSMIDSMQK